jgi:hypothetical protein
MKKGNNRLINLVLFFSMFGVFVIAAHGYVVCQSDYPDELSELTAVCQTPTFPVFASDLNNPLSLIGPLKISCFQRTDLCRTCLRC